MNMQNALKGRQAQDDKPGQLKGARATTHNQHAEWHSLNVRPEEGKPGQMEGAGGTAKAQSDVERVRLLDEPALHGGLGGMAPQGVHTSHDTCDRPAAEGQARIAGPGTYLC